MATVTPEFPVNKDQNQSPSESTKIKFTGQGDGFPLMQQQNGVDAGVRDVFDNSSAPQKSVSDVKDCSPTKGVPWQRSSLKHIHDLYDTVTQITVEPTSREEPDVKAFFKVLKNHRLQSKLVYVLTVVAIVAISHFVLTVKWILPYYYSITTPFLLILRLIMYWKMKYQYFLLDFCYFANTYWFLYIWLAPDNKEALVVGYAVANGPLIWALLVFRNSLVFHSLDKVTSLYIHLLPCLLSFVIRWYPDETSEHWYKPFAQYEVGFSFFWLVFIPFVFVVCHQVLYIFLVNCVLKPNEEYLTMYRYLTSKESSLIFRMCNLFGPRFRVQLYVAWGLTLVLIMLLFTPVWYNFFIPHCVVVVFSIIVAIYNGATYYIDVFSFEGLGKNKAVRPEQNVTSNPVSQSCNEKIAFGTNMVSQINSNERVVYGTMVTSSQCEGEPYAV
ncbi:unnamed protein product [Lymnaea stagnalis]|uniref:Glycerophosphocholine acyltransferase 1 n=1 Tax=Lymnaea stagnalis TaxID=6523 RepID=A0AAV2H057_LYMST